MVKFLGYSNFYDYYQKEGNKPIKKDKINNPTETLRKLLKVN